MGLPGSVHRLFCCWQRGESGRWWNTRLHQLYSVGQNCIVFAGNDKKFRDDTVGRGILRHLRRQRGYMFNNRLEEGFE